MRANATREEWLNACARAIAPWVTVKGRTMPEYRISCGWPSRAALSRSRKRIGECWAPEVSADQVTEMFISPLIADPAEVAGIVAHELIHAAGVKGHRANFALVARTLDLEGQPTATTIGDAFKQRIAPVLERIGPYPHGGITATTREKKQTTRLLKVECGPCAEEREPYIVRMSAKTLALAPPVCGVCGEGMEEVDFEG